MTAGLTIFFVVFNQMKSNEKGAYHSKPARKSERVDQTKSMGRGAASSGAAQCVFSLLAPPAYDSCC